MRPVLIITGLSALSDQHWTRLWLKKFPFTQALELSSPNLEAWISALDQGIRQFPDGPVLVAYESGCLALAHWASRHEHPIQGALLVAPVDPEVDSQFEEFTPLPKEPFPFKSVLVASANHPLCDLGASLGMARAWGSDLLEVGEAGRIDEESGHGSWVQGEHLLRNLM